MNLKALVLSMLTSRTQTRGQLAIEAGVNRGLVARALRALWVEGAAVRVEVGGQYVGWRAARRCS